MMRYFVSLMLFTAAVAVADPTTQPTTVPTTSPAVVWVGVPKTEDFESGKRQLSELSDDQIETFLADLLQRLSYDHDANGQRGPDGDYLEGWSRKVADEMKDRGYTYTPEKVLIRPDGTPAPGQR